MEIDEENYFSTKDFIQELALALVKSYKVETLEDLHNLKKDLQSLSLTCKSSNKIINRLIYEYETDKDALAFNELILKKRPKINYQHTDKNKLQTFEKSYYLYAFLGFPYALRNIEIYSYPPSKIKQIFDAANVQVTFHDFNKNEILVLSDTYVSQKINKILRNDYPEKIYESFAHILQKFPQSSQLFLNKILQKILNRYFYPPFLYIDLLTLQAKYGTIEK